MKQKNNAYMKLRKSEKELVNTYFYGVPALAERKNNFIFLLLTMGPGVLICALPLLRVSFPFFQNKNHLLFVILATGVLSGLFARFFLKKLSICWKSTLSNFLRRKPDTQYNPFKVQIIDDILTENHTWVFVGYVFSFCFIFFGSVYIDYYSVSLSFSRSDKNSIIPLIALVFCGFIWGLVNFLLILKIDCLLSDVNY